MNFFKTASNAVKTNGSFFKKAFWLTLILVYLVVFIKLFVVERQ